MARSALKGRPQAHASEAAAPGAVEQIYHVLIVDDDPHILELCRLYLEAADPLGPCGTRAVLHTASTGEEALAAARELAERGVRLTCALVDIILPGGRDGIDTMLRLWELDPAVQCTLVTGAGERVERAIEERIPPGFLDRWDFLAKPFTEFEIVQRTRRALNHWHAQRNVEVRCEENVRLLAELSRANRELERKVRERTRVLAERNAELETKNRELEQALRDLERAQTQLLQQEKMASIGMLAAGVAHELNNPIGFVHSNLGTLARYCEKLRTLIDAYEERLGDADPALEALKRELKVDFMLEDLPALVAESTEGTDRVRKIVSDLKGFSRPDESEARYTDLNEGLRSTLNIVHNETKYKATVHTDLGDLPEVRCFPGQLNQVFLNLLVNAAQAIEEQGDIHVRTRADGDWVEVVVRDTGCGMTPEVAARVFDPFFTTKGPGRGTGLGLSISYEIVKRHGGTIHVESAPGAGTTFTVRLPVRGPEGTDGGR